MYKLTLRTEQRTAREECWTVLLVKLLVTSFSSVLPTSRVSYHAGKPIESVVYCFYKITSGRIESFR